MNNKGFTLVELLAVAVILVLISMIAIPSFTNIYKNNSRKLTLDDGKKFLAQAEYKIKMDREFRLSGRNDIQYSLKELDEKKELVYDPDGGLYDESSYVKYQKTITCYRETVVESGGVYVYTNKITIDCSNVNTADTNYRYTRDEKEEYCLYLKGSKFSVATVNGCCVNSLLLNTPSSVVENSEIVSGVCS